jgi:hypothetical protein
MAIDLTKKGGVSPAVIKLALRHKIIEAKDLLKIRRAMERDNINRAIGVGSTDAFVAEFNVEYKNTRAGSDPKPSKRKLKKVSSSLPKGLL